MRERKKRLIVDYLTFYRARLCPNSERVTDGDVQHLSLEASAIV